MRSAVAYLIHREYQQDDYGVLQETECKRKVYVDVQSVGSQEFFEGGQMGLKPSLKFTMFEYDYKNEEVIEYNCIQYTIYRTYIRRYDTIELFTQKRIGNE